MFVVICFAKYLTLVLALAQPRFSEAAALEELVSKGVGMEPEALGGHSMTCLIGPPGTIVACRQSGVLLMVIVRSPFNFLGWEASVVGHTEDGFLKAELYLSTSALSWHSVEDLQDWLSIPTRPVLQNAFGPLILVQTSEALDLPHARIAEGLDLTVKQCLTVLAHYGQKAAGKSEMELYMQIFSMFLDSEAEQQEALKKSNMGKSKKAADEEQEEGEEQEDLSDYEDLLEQIEETGNLGDPDVKNEKSKVKKTRAKRALQEAFELLDSRSKARGRGRGRGRGRAGRGRGKGRGKGRGRRGVSGQEQGGYNDEKTQAVVEEKAKTGVDKGTQEAKAEGLEKEGVEREYGETSASSHMKMAEGEAQEEAESSQKREAERDEKAIVESEGAKGSVEVTSGGSQAVAPATPAARPRAPNLHETPEILSQLCPPQAKIVLNHMDHRHLGVQCKTLVFWLIYPRKGLHLGFFLHMHPPYSLLVPV